MKLSAIIKAGVCLLGVFGVGNALVAPASAQQAAARAAVTITNPGSFTQSVSGEVLLPDGLYFGGTTDANGVPATLVVTPGVTSPDGTTFTINSLTFDAGEVEASPTSSPSIAGVVASILQGDNGYIDSNGDPVAGINAETIDEAAAIIKAAVGINGLE